MKTTHYILFLICLVATLNCEAKREPAWMRELPKPGNDTYIYVRESGEGTTVEIALAQAMVRVFQSTANRLGQPFDAQKVNNDLINGADYRTISKQQSIPVNRVGVYSTQLSNGKWWVYVLCHEQCRTCVGTSWPHLNLRDAGIPRQVHRPSWMGTDKQRLYQRGSPHHGW